MTEDARTILDILAIVERVTVIGILLLIIGGGLRQLWVFGWQYREQQQRHTEVAESMEHELNRLRAECAQELDQMRQERNRWQDMMLRNSEVSQRSLEMVESLLEGGRQRRSPPGS